MAMYDPLRVSEETLRTLAEIMERFERKPSEDTLVTLVMHKIPGGGTGGVLPRAGNGIRSPRRRRRD